MEIFESFNQLPKMFFVHCQNFSNYTFRSFLNMFRSQLFYIYYEPLKHESIKFSNYFHKISCQFLFGFLGASQKSCKIFPQEYLKCLTKVSEVVYRSFANFAENIVLIMYARLCSLVKHCFLIDLITINSNASILVFTQYTILQHPKRKRVL